MSEIICKTGADIIADCTKPALAGSGKEVLIIPRVGVKNIVYNANIDDNGFVIEDIERYDDGDNYVTRAFSYVVQHQTKPSHEYSEDDFGGNYIHRLPLKIVGLTAKVRYEIAKHFKDGEGVIAILKQNYREGNSKYLVLGAGTGLFLEQDNDEENRNISDLILATKEEAKEPVSGYHFFDTDMATTEAKIEDLKSTDLPTP